MKLHIANTTKQIADFCFRMLENERLIYRKIMPGTQEIIIKDGTADEIDFVIRQHAPYGLKDCRDIDHSRIYIGLCYSIDKPVPPSLIEKAIRDNDDHLIRAGHERRKASVAAMDKTMSEAGEITGYKGGIEMSAVEQVAQGNNDGPSIDERIQADDGQQSQRKGRGRPRSK